MTGLTDACWMIANSDVFAKGVYLLRFGRLPPALYAEVQLLLDFVALGCLQSGSPSSDTPLTGPPPKFSETVTRQAVANIQRRMSLMIEQLPYSLESYFQDWRTVVARFGFLVRRIELWNRRRELHSELSDGQKGELDAILTDVFSLETDARLFETEGKGAAARRRMLTAPATAEKRRKRGNKYRTIAKTVRKLRSADPPAESRDIKRAVLRLAKDAYSKLCKDPTLVQLRLAEPTRTPRQLNKALLELARAPNIQQEQRADAELAAFRFLDDSNQRRVLRSCIEQLDATGDA